ncbi:hypothetical protein [Paenibacillus sp. BIHB 4019]|uniref:hypothetical protein n=1 Tax=Paenibacillus sp. BIHB 4019 TaxID=1870819 RepID=UPI000C149AEF|nr:hypothetical protein [Paenibacillus sp. BIHB 4019]
MIQKRSIIGAAIGLVIAAATSWLLPEFITVLIPVAATLVGVVLDEKRLLRKTNIIDAIPSPARASSEPGQLPEAVQPSSSGGGGAFASAPAPAISPIFDPVLEYLEVLEDMVISEGQKNTLDNEIVEKSCSLFLRLHRVLPLLTELNNDEINHTVRRLVLKELNSVINPFLRLSGDAKTKNRRILLNGLRDINTKISEIVATIEHKDLMELQTKAEVIHKRYNYSEF